MGQANVAAYLSAALGFPISRDEVAPLCESQNRAGSQLAAALQEPVDPFSSSERILLAMLCMDPLPTSMTQVSALVHAYVEAVDALPTGQTTACSLLSPSMDGGGRY